MISRLFLAFALTLTFAAPGNAEQADTKPKPKSKPTPATPEDISKLRGPCAGRPKFESIVFDKTALKTYLDGLPENIRKTESERVKLIQEIKSYMLGIFARNTYEGPVVTKKNTFPQGVIAMANENSLMVKTTPNAKNATKIRWVDLPLEQFENMLPQIAGKRLKIAQGTSAAEAEQIKMDAAEDYIRLSLLCDWCGEYEKALMYAKLAAKTHPSAEARIAGLLLR